MCSEPRLLGFPSRPIQKTKTLAVLASFHLLSLFNEQNSIRSVVFLYSLFSKLSPKPYSCLRLLRLLFASLLAVVVQLLVISTPPAFAHRPGNKPFLLSLQGECTKLSSNVVISQKKKRKVTRRGMAHIQCGQSFLRKLLRNQSFQKSLGYDYITNPLISLGQGLRYRKLEIILTTTIDKLGKAGETVKVAPGHFRNHLMPKLLAVPNIEKYAYLIREQRKIYQREEEAVVTEVPKTKENKMKEYQMAAKLLDSSRLVLRRLIKGENDLRSPVTKDELVAEVGRQLFVNIQAENLHLPSPLAQVGEFEVPLRLPKQIPMPEGKLQWTLHVKIRRK